jgi:predicted ribosome quality control (RQC) complex YloA/Tae2 family protein
LRYSSSIPVDYTQIKNVKKIPKVPGYKVILKNQKTMFIDIDEELISYYL